MCWALAGIPALQFVDRTLQFCNQNVIAEPLARCIQGAGEVPQLSIRSRIEPFPDGSFFIRCCEVGEQ